MANSIVGQRIAQVIAVYATLIILPIIYNPSSKLEFNELASVGRVMRHFTDALILFLMNN